jgi:uncharacterized ubiquitin-like protein YukD
MAPKRNIYEDLDIPLDISAYELTRALNATYQLGIDVSDIKKCFLKAENPIALLRGIQSLKDYGIRDGSIIIFSE